MGIFTVGALMAIITKLAIGFGGVAVVAKGVNWFNKKDFNSPKKAGALNDRIKHDSEEI